MFKQKSIRRVLFCMSSLLLICSFVLDIRIAAGTMQAKFTVGDDYISSIFSGILTFSTLSLTVLSMIVSVLDTQNFGLKLRDLLSFDASPIRFTHYIFLSMVLTLFSVAALAFELYTFISAVAVIAIVYTTFTSIEVFRIISNSEICKKIVFSEIENQNHRILDKHIANWINEYKNAIIRNYKPEIKMYAEILKKCSEHTDSSVFVNHLQDLFETACKNHSAAEAIYLAFNSIGMTSYTMEICRESIQSIKYYELSKIIKMDLPAAITSIINSDFHLVPREKERLAYAYFQAIIYSNIPRKEKIELLKAMVDKITRITEDDFGSVKSKLINRITNNDIICTDNEISEALYEILMKSLYCNNLSNKNPILVATAARILRSIYFYSTLAVSIFDEPKRNRIAQMGKKRIMLDYISDVSIKNWIIGFREEFLSFYIQDAFNLELSVFGDADTNVGAIEKGLHYMLWNNENKLRFAFWYYFACCQTTKVFPLQKHLEETQNLRDYHWEVCACLLDEFHENSSALTDHSMTNIKSLIAYDSDWQTLFIFPEQLQNTYNIIHVVIDARNTATD